jgi:hypothetical protein
MPLLFQHLDRVFHHKHIAVRPALSAARTLTCRDASDVTQVT